MNTPVSVKIRARLRAAGKRFHANDSIADHIEPNELPQLQDEVEQKLLGVLQSLVIDTEGDHNTRGTARRIAAERADDHRPDHDTQRVFASLVSDSRQIVDRRAAQRTLASDRSVQVFTARGLGNEPAANSGRSGDTLG